MIERVRKPPKLGSLAMIVRNGFAASLAALALGSTTAHAGPCSTQIYNDDLAIGKRLGAAAAHGKTAPESQGALLHRQPTPLSVAGAEAKAGDLSEAEVKAITEFMDEARKADAVGDAAACQKAIADAERMLGR
jgi:hypothetical protein